MFQEFPEKNKDDDFLNEFRQRLANQANVKVEEKQKELQRSKSVFLGAIAGVGLACVVGWFALSPKSAEKNEEIPVVRRPATAVKLKPAEPGGMEISNQDKTVYDIIDKSSDNKSNVEHLLPPPEEPKLPEISSETMENAETISDVVDTIDAGEKVIDEIPEPQPLKVEEAEAKTQTIAETANSLPVKEEVKTEPVKVEPKVEPVKEEPKAEPVKVEPVKEEPKAEPVVTSAPAGSWQIQLMSSKNKEGVEKGWATLAKKHSSLNGLFHEVETADLGFDGIFYRLKAGAFSNKADADNICNQIKAQGGSCIVKKK